MPQSQAVSGAQSQAQTQAQAFLSPPLPPGYSYPAMPYYPALPGTFQYPLLMPANAKQPTQYPPYTGTLAQYNTFVSDCSPHMGCVCLKAEPALFRCIIFVCVCVCSGFDDLSQGAEFSKGYGGSAQTQPKGANSTGKGDKSSTPLPS